MASNGVISQPCENLNFDTVISHSRCNNFSSYVRYLIWLIELEAGSSRIFSVKCSAGQLIYLFNLGIIDQFNSPFFVMIKGLISSISMSFSMKALKSCPMSFIHSLTCEFSSPRAKAIFLPWKA